MTFTDTQLAELQKPLDPKYIVKPSGQFGPKGDYLEGWHVINEANRIFGYDGWSYRIDLKQDALAQQPDGKWAAAYTCVCTIIVGDVTRQDVGFGSGFAKQIGDAIEGATKEAATDALKRVLRTFGNQFGLALYDKSRANVSAPEPEGPPASVGTFLAGLQATDNRRAYWTAYIGEIPQEWVAHVTDQYRAMKKATAPELEKAA